MVSGSHSHFRMLLASCLSAVFAAAMLIQFSNTSAQTAAPILISHADSTRAISFESVTQQREPFSTPEPVKFGIDNHTRIMLFAMNLPLQPGDTAGSVSVSAEDFAHRLYQLPVEYVGSVPDQAWATSVVFRLGDGMDDLGDVLVRI